MKATMIDHLLSTAAAATASGTSTGKVWPHMDKLIISKYNPASRDGNGGIIPFLESHPGLKELTLMMGRYDDTLSDALANIHPPPPNLTYIWQCCPSFGRTLAYASLRHPLQLWHDPRSCFLTPVFYAI
ncbi:unnamed protein product [Absidia cylindrospora]